MAVLSRTCPICGSSEIELAVPSPVGDAETLENLSKHFSGYDTWQSFLSFVRCLSCDLLYSQKYPDEADLRELYGNVAQNEVGQDGPALDATHNWLAKEFVAKGLGQRGVRLRVLEIGPDTGRFASAFAEQVEVSAIDFVEPNLSVWADLTRRFGGESAVVGSITEVNPSHRYDVIVAHHVFDHVPDLLGLMKAINGLSADGATLSVVVHNHRSLLRRVMRSKWPPFCLQHPQLFSRRALAQLLEQSGWTVREVRRQVDFVGVFATLNNLVGVFGGRRRSVPRRDVVVPVRFGNIGIIADRAPSGLA